jgi:hypothetical protein
MPFAIASPALIQDRRLTLTDTRTLLGLLSFTQPDRLECWPSRKTLAERMGVSSLSRISQTISRLETLGWLDVTRREGSSVYRILDPTTPRTVDPPTPRPVDNEGTTEGTRKDPLTPLQGDVVVDIEPVAEPEAAAVDQAITPDQAAFVIALFNTATGARLDATARPLQRLVNRRLRTYTPAQLQCAIAFYASLWRGTPMEPHSRNLRTVLSPTRIEFALSETARKSGAGAGAATRIWKPDPPPQKAEPAKVRTCLSDMLKALRG